MAARQHGDLCGLVAVFKARLVQSGYFWLKCLKTV